MRSVSTKLFNLTKKPYDRAGITEYAMSLRNKEFPLKQVNRPTQKQGGPSPIMSRAVKAAGLL